MEGWVIAVVVILVGLMAGISGLVAYLLYRPGARKRRPQKNGMTPDGRVATKYADPPENGDVRLTMPNDGDELVLPPYSSKETSLKSNGKHARLDVEEDSNPDDKALLEEVKVEPQERAVDVGTLEGKAPESSESCDEEKKFIRTPSTKSKSSSSSSVSSVREEDKVDGDATSSKHSKDGMKLPGESSTSSSSEGEIPQPMPDMKPHIVRDDHKDGIGARDSPDLVSDVLAVVDGNQNREPSSSSSSIGSDREGEKSSSSSSPDEDRILQPVARERKPGDASEHPISQKGLQENPDSSSSSTLSDEGRTKVVPTPKERNQKRPDGIARPGDSSSSSSSDGDKIIPVVAPRTTYAKPLTPSSPSSESDDERRIRTGEVPTQTTPPRKRSKRKKMKRSTPPTSAKFPISTQTSKLAESSSSSSEDTEVARGYPITTVPVGASKKTSSSSSSTSPEEAVLPGRKRPRDDITFISIWNRPAKLRDLYSAGVVSEKTVERIERGTIKKVDVELQLRPYLVGAEPVAGILLSETGEKISIYSAWKRGLIKRGICLSLLEAQAATGRILDPKTGIRYSVEEAVKEGVIDKQFEGNLARAERAVHGYTTRSSPKVLSLYQAMKKELVVEDHGIRLLEAQIATGGIIDPNSNHRLPIEAAYKRGLIDREMNFRLENPTDDVRGFVDPNTEEKLAYSELMRRCVIDTDTGMRLLPLQAERPSWATPKPKVTPKLGVTLATQTEYVSSTSSSTSSSSTSEAEMEICIVSGEISTQTPDYPMVRKKKRKAPKTYRRVSPPVDRTPSLKSASIPSSESEREHRYTPRVGPRPFSVSPPTYRPTSPYSERSTQTLFAPKTQTPKRTKSKEPSRPIEPKVIRLMDSSVQTERTSSSSSSPSESEEETRPTIIRTEWDYHVRPVDERLVPTGTYVKEKKVVTSETRHEPHHEMEPVTIDLGRQDLYKVVTVVDIPPPVKKIFFTTSWGKQVDLNSLHEAGIVNAEMKTHLETGKMDPSDEVVIRLIMPYLSCNRPIAGILLIDTGKKISIFEAAKRGLIRRTSAVALLEAQAATGNLIDPHTGRKMTIEEAQKDGFIDGGYEAIVMRAGRSVHGYETRSSSHPLSVFEAMKHGIIQPNHGIRLLEAQLATGGIIDPKVGHRLPLEAAYRRKLFDQHTMNTLNDPKNEDKGFVDPNTQKNVTYLEIISKCVTDLETGVLLFPLESQERGRPPTKSSASVKSSVNLDVISPSRSRSRERSDVFSLPKASTSSASSSSDESRRRKKAKKETISVYRSIELIKTPVMSGEDDDAFERGRSLSLKTDSEDEERNRKVRTEIQTRIGKEENERVIERKVNEVSTTAITIESIQKFQPVKLEVDLNQVEKKEKESSSSSSSHSEDEKMEAEATKDIKTIVEKDSGSEITTTTTMVTTTEVVTERKRRSIADIKFKSGWNRQASLLDLFSAGVVTQETVTNLEEGIILEEDVENSLQQYLIGAEPIAGILISETGEKISIYSAWRRGMIRRGTSISLLEAQAATGRILDPTTGNRYSVSDASKEGLIDRQFGAVLARAERAVYGYTTRSSPDVISLFQAMKRGLVVENHGIRLLEAQIATGGIIDPNANHRLPVDIAYERGLFDKRINLILEDPGDDTRGFFDPNTEENLTYLELMERCITDTGTGMRLLPLRTHRGSTSAMKSKVIFESRTGRQVTLNDLVNANRVDEKTATRINQGAMTSAEKDILVARLRVFVDGTMPIAGVINIDTGERTSIYEAAKSGLIKRGTAFELLEAQACCGKLINVQNGRVITIETALRTGVIDKEFKDVVERAHRAVTGYREPFKRELLSLCEAINRQLIVQKHGMRLLEAQIATGGIIDVRSPVRITPNVALKRALIDAKLAEDLEEKRTQSYFDPVTGENLNYSEMMGRCVTDKDTGLLYLMVEGGTVTGYVRPFEPDHASKIRSQSASPGKLFTEEVTTTRSASATTLGAEVTTTIETTETTKKRKKKSRKSSGVSTSSASSTTGNESTGAESPSKISRKVIIVDPDTNEEITVREALKRKLIDKETARQLIATQGEFEETP